MKEKEKAPGVVAAATEAAEETMVDTDISTHSYYNDTGRRIASLLMHGEKNALLTKEVFRHTGLTHPGDLQTAFETERDKDIPVLTKTGSKVGFFLLSDGHQKAILERRKYCHFMEAIGKGCFHSSKAARKMLHSLERDLNGPEKNEEDCYG